MLLNKRLPLKIYIPENVKFVSNGLIREQSKSKFNFSAMRSLPMLYRPDKVSNRKNAKYNDFVQTIVSTEFLILNTQSLFRPEIEVIEGWRKLRNKKTHTSYTLQEK